MPRVRPALALTGSSCAAALGAVLPRDACRGIGPIRAPGSSAIPGWACSCGVGRRVDRLDRRDGFFSLRLIELGADAGSWASAGRNAVLEIPTMLAYRRLVAGSRSGCSSPAPRSLSYGRCCSPSRVRDRPRRRCGARRRRLGLFLVGTTTVARRAPASLLATAQALFTSTAYAIGSIVGGILAGLVARGASRRCSRPRRWRQGSGRR